MMILPFVVVAFIFFATIPSCNGMINWNVEQEPLPQKIVDRVKTLDVTVDTVDVQGIPVRYRYVAIPDDVQPSGQSLLLLHGAAFSSQTWASEKMKTLHYLAAMGHDAVAIDLPGYGDTPRRNVPDRAAFLVEVMQKLSLHLPVVVSPSMSGGWSLPLITEKPETVGGYVPVAPGAAGQFAKKLSSLTEIPTMIVYGEYDSGARYSTAALKNIPNHVVVELEKSYHPAYLDQPAKWHQVLYNFMNDLKGF